MIYENDFVVLKDDDWSRSCLREFLENLGAHSVQFRYYNKRPISTYNSHLVTVLYFQNNTPVAYGHLDKENFDVWLGISVVEGFSGKGLGNSMMNYLMTYAEENQLGTIKLSVDINNKKARQLYEKFQFEQVSINTEKEIIFYQKHFQKVN